MQPAWRKIMDHVIYHNCAIRLPWFGLTFCLNLDEGSHICITCVWSVISYSCPAWYRPYYNRRAWVFLCSCINESNSKCGHFELNTVTDTVYRPIVSFCWIATSANVRTVVDTSLAHRHHQSIDACQVVGVMYVTTIRQLREYGGCHRTNVSSLWCCPATSWLAFLVSPLLQAGLQYLTPWCVTVPCSNYQLHDYFLLTPFYRPRIVFH